MKKTVGAMLCVLIAIQFGLGILSISNREIGQLAGLEERYCESFSIPDDRRIDNPEKVCGILKEAADRNHVNIIRTLLTEGANSGYEVVKFLYLSGESRYFDALNITHHHMYHLDITLRPLEQQADYFKTSGLYYMELSDGGMKDRFLKELKQGLEEEFYITLDEQDFHMESSPAALPYTDSGFYMILEAVTVFLIIACCMYWYFRETKQMAVNILFGVAKARTIFSLQKGLYLISFIGIAAGAGALLLYSKDPSYVWEIVRGTVAVFILLFGLLFISGLFLLHTLHVRTALAGKGFAGHILRLNYIAKAVCVLAVLYIGGSIFAEYRSCMEMKKGFQSWERADEYGTFYPYYIGYDLTAQEQSDAERTVSCELYPELNARGAIFINARNFEQEYLELNGGRSPFDAVTVNLNYLKAYPVTDETGQEITVSENETDWILLVPEKYKGQENELSEMFSDKRQACFEASETAYGESIPDPIKKQKIKILWMADGQEVFSFNPYVCPENGNRISEPVIQVMTTGNSCAVDRDCIQGNGGSDPLKIKLSGDGRKTYTSLEGILDELHLEDNLKHIVSCNEEAEQKIRGIYANIRFSAAMLIVLAFVWIMDSFQSAVLLFDKNKKDFVIKRISGWNWHSVYGKYLWAELAVLLPLTAVPVALDLNQGAGVACYLCMDAAIVCIEAAVFWTCIRRSEKNKIVETLKGA